MAHPFLERLARGPMLADGAMGSLLRAYGAADGQCLEELNLSQGTKLEVELERALYLVKD